MDKETVIKGLENLKETIRTATQYTFTSGNICAMNMTRIDNAIALLEEQEEQKRRMLQYIADNQFVNSPTYGKDDNAAYWYDVIEAWHEGR